MLKLLLMFQLAIVPIKGYHHEGIRDSVNTYVVIHSDESRTEGGALSYLKRTRKAYHYYITRKGKVYRMVDPKFIANHAGYSIYKGRLHWNEFAIGICFANAKGESYTTAQYKSGKELIAILSRRYPTIDNEHIVRHRDIAIFRGKTDPGPKFNMDRIRINTPVPPKD